jgi:surface antigen/uncharacterized protein YukE
MAQLGMDVDAVEAAGRQLQAKAQSLDAVVANLDKTVASLNGVWDGKDAQTFINEWWPEHKKALSAASASVAGLGQSALNNASEQRQASGISGAGVAGLGAAGLAAAVGGGAILAAGNPAPAGAGGAAEGSKGATSGSLPPASDSEQATYHQFEASTSHYDAGVGYNVDANGKGVDNCTAWADWRREQLGYASTGGTGGEMAGKAGGSASIAPTLGALGSYMPTDAGTAGHVFIVEGITSNNPPTIHISEANYANSPDVHYRDLTQGTDGKWYGQGMGAGGYSIDFSPAG